MEIMEINRKIQEFTYTDNVMALIEALNDFMTRFEKEELETPNQVRASVYGALLMNGCRGDMIPLTGQENVTIAFRTRKSVFLTGIDIGKTAEEIIEKRKDISIDRGYFEGGRNVYFLALPFSEAKRQFSQWMIERVSE